MSDLDKVRQRIEEAYDEAMVCYVSIQSDAASAGMRVILEHLFQGLKTIEYVKAVENEKAR